MAEKKNLPDHQTLAVVTQTKYDFDYRQIGRWLPHSADPSLIEDFLANISLYPQTLPQTEREMEFHQALIREVIRSNQKEEAEVDSLIINPEVAKICRSDQEGLLTILDGFLPWGMVKVFKISENGPKVATVLCFEEETNAKSKGKVAEILLDFGLAQKQKSSLEEDDLTLIPSSSEEKVTLEIKCLSGYKIARKKELKVEATGGTVGIVFDTRIRPFKFPDFSQEGRVRVAKWRKALGIV